MGLLERKTRKNPLFLLNGRTGFSPYTIMDYD